MARAILLSPLSVGRQAVPAPIRFGILPRAVTRQPNPKFEGVSHVEADAKGFIQSRDLSLGARPPVQIAI